MSYINWGGETPEQLAIRARLEQEALFEQAVRMRMQSQAGVAGGGGKQQPQAITISSEHVAVWYNDTVSGAAKFFIVNYEDLTFSNEIVLADDYTAITGPSFREMVNGRGWLVRTRSGSTYTYFFIDAGGNLIEKVSFTGPRSDYSFDGRVSALSYTDTAGAVTLKWWDGNRIFTKTFANVNASNVYLGWFSWDANTADGTFSIYYYDTALSKERVYLVKAHTGQLIEITDLLTYSGYSNYDNGMCGPGNYMFATFQTDAESSSTASYTNLSTEVTLSAPNTSIRIGDLITGPSIDSFTYIIGISGTTLTLSKPVTGTETSVTVDFTGNRMEILRIIKTDGTYVDYDLLQYNQWGTNELYLFGTNKLAMLLYAEPSALPNALISFRYDGVDMHLDSKLINTEIYPNYDIFNSNKLYAFDGYQNSPAGSESFGVIYYDDSNYDGTMYRYVPLTVVWTDTQNGDIYSYTPELGVVNFTYPPPTPGFYAEGTYTGVSVVNGVGFAGTTLTVDAVVNSSGDITSITLAAAGSGYKVGDQAVILGSSLGGSTPSDNITLTITEVETFGLSTSNNGLAAPAMLYANSPSSLDLELLLLKQDGTTVLATLPTQYADAGSYFEVTALGDDYVLFTHYDDDEGPTIQFWGIWDIAANGFIDDSWFWTTTDNSWSTNYDTFWMSENSANLTYWWNSAQGSLGNNPTTVGTGSLGGGYALADYNDGSVFVDYHQTGTTLLNLSQTEGYVLSSNFTPPAQLDLNGDLYITKLNKTHVYNIWQDSGNNNYFVVDVYDLEGTKIQTIATSLDNYYDFRVIGDRIYLSQVDGGNLIIYAISPTTYITKTISQDGWSSEINDWYWW